MFYIFIYVRNYSTMWCPMVTSSSNNVLHCSNNVRMSQNWLVVGVPSLWWGFANPHGRILWLIPIFFKSQLLLGLQGGRVILHPLPLEWTPSSVLLFVITNLASPLGLFSHSREQNPILFLNLSFVKPIKAIRHILHTLTFTRMRTAYVPNLNTTLNLHLININAS